MIRRVTHTIRNFPKNKRIFNYSKVKSDSILLYPTVVSRTGGNFSFFRYSSNVTPTEHVVDSVLDHATYERVCTETMDALNDYIEELLESVDTLPGSDISYSDGVLTVKLGSEHGTYVINRQTPNRQIWLSSPTTGPKRYDFVGPASAQFGKWVYRHTGKSLHELLQNELQNIFKEQKVAFENLPYGR